MSVATSTAIGLGIAGAGSIASGIIGANAAGNAASTQANAANNAAALESQAENNSLNFNKLQYGNTLALESPWINTGQAANTRLAYLMGLTPNTGLPPGVVNPNAPPPTSTNNLSSIAGLLNGTGVNGGNGQAVLPTNAGSRPGFGEIAEGGQVPMAAANNATRLSSLAQPGTTDTAQVGQVGIQPGMIRQPGAVTDPSNPAASTTAGFQSPTGITGGPIIAGSGTLTNGAPGTQSTNVGGTAQVPMVNGGSTNNVANPGDFGSLAQGFNEQFAAPTGVTEQNDPGYQFRLNQGTQAIQNSAAARGGLLTGGTAKSLNDYAQGDASNEYSNVYNRALTEYQQRYNIFNNNQTTQFNRLSALSGTGQTTASQLSSAGQLAANNNSSTSLTGAGQIGQQINNAGAANASGYVGGANAINGALSGLTGTASLLALLNGQNGGNGTGASNTALAAGALAG